MKRKILLLLLAVFTLSGCGATDTPIIIESSPSVEIEIPVSPEASESSSVSESEESSESQEIIPETPASTPEPEITVLSNIQNNGTLFVQSGDLVFFRIPTTESMYSGSIDSDFLKLIPGSTLASYDMATGEIKELMTDNSYGNLYFSGNLLMITNSMDDETRTYTLLEGLDLKTNSVTEYNGNAFLGIDPNGKYVVADNYDYRRNNFCYDIYENGKFYASISPDGLYSYVGFCDNTIVYIVGDDEYNYSLWSYDLASNEEIYLGELPAFEEDSYYPGLPEQVVAQGSSLYFSLAHYEGTGHFYTDAKLIKADVHTAESLEELYLAGSDEEYPIHAPRFTVTLGNVNTVSGIPGTAGVNSDTGYIGYYDENGDWNPVAAGYGTEYSSDYENVTMIETAELIDGRIYFVLNELIHTPEDDIGWRTAYRRTSTKIAVIDVITKEVTVLAEITCP